MRDHKYIDKKLGKNGEWQYIYDEATREKDNLKYEAMYQGYEKKRNQLLKSPDYSESKEIKIVAKQVTLIGLYYLNQVGSGKLDNFLDDHLIHSGRKFMEDIV